MKKVVLTLLKIAGIVLLVLILLIAGFLFWLSRAALCAQQLYGDGGQRRGAGGQIPGHGAL